MSKYTANRAGVLRYLAYRGQELDEEMKQLIEQIIQLCEQTARPRYLTMVCQLSSDRQLLLPQGGKLFLPGNDIHTHLQQAKQCLLIAATLGMEVELKLRQLQSQNMTSALIFDAACDALIEDVVDQVQEECALQMAANGLSIGKRYSPGYGDLPLSLQKQLLAVLNAQRRIGLTVSDSYLLIPRKSVTALAAIYTAEAGHAAAGTRSGSCNNCRLYANCPYRRGGSYCDSHKQ